MKKLLTGITFLSAFVMIYAASNDSSKALGDRMNMAVMAANDTVPSDTAKKDTMFELLSSYNLKDTIPKDTTRKDTTFASAVAYRLVTDTVPADTAKKDTMFQALAYNR